MDLSGLILIGGILSYVGLIIYIANHIDAARKAPVVMLDSTSQSSAR